MKPVDLCLKGWVYQDSTISLERPLRKEQDRGNLHLPHVDMSGFPVVLR